MRVVVSSRIFVDETEPEQKPPTPCCHICDARFFTDEPLDLAITGNRTDDHEASPPASPVADRRRAASESEATMTGYGTDVNKPAPPDALPGTAAGR